MLYTLSIVFGSCLDIFCIRILKLSKIPFIFILNILVMIILNDAFDNQVIVFKGFLYFQILIFASLYDLRRRIIPDYVHISIIIIGLINCDLANSIVGLVLVPLPYLLAAIIRSNSMGGGDIKLMGALGFILGTASGYIAGCVGLSLAIFYAKVVIKDKYESIPLAPFLGIGGFLMFLIR